MFLAGKTFLAPYSSRIKFVPEFLAGYKTGDSLYSVEQTGRKANDVKDISVALSYLVWL